MSRIRFERTQIPLDRLKQNDWPGDLRDLRRSLPEHMAAQGPPGNARKGSWFVVARLERIVGYAWAVAMPGRLASAYIEEVVVAPDWREKGVGGQLLRRIACYMLDIGRPELSIYPLGSPGWVTRVGFEEFGDGRTFVADASLVCAGVESDGPDR